MRGGSEIRGRGIDYHYKSLIVKRLEAMVVVYRTLVHLASRRTEVLRPGSSRLGCVALVESVS